MVARDWEEVITSIIYLEDGDGIFLRNVDSYVQDTHHHNPEDGTRNEDLLSLILFIPVSIKFLVPRAPPLSISLVLRTPFPK
jgi:hypothetical protein